MPRNEAHTLEFGREFEAETERLLRVRFLWFLGLVGTMYLLGTLILASMLGSAFMSDSMLPGGAGMQLRVKFTQLLGGEYGIAAIGALTLADLCVFAFVGFKVTKHRLKREALLRLTQNFLIYRGLVDVVLMCIQSPSMPVYFPWSICSYHVLACLFLPWTPSQAARPMLPILLGHSLGVLLFGPAAAGWKAFWIIFSCFAMGPGSLIAYFKHSRRLDRFRQRMIQARFGEMRRELLDARRIHEALFPPASIFGSLKLDYLYQPMRQIGGDYLYARCLRRVHEAGEACVLNIVLMDVTGHGIPAALTVNRLYGELERIYGEDPEAGPGEVLCALNRYVHLTLANHSVFATALCMQIDEQRGLIRFASGGHPPAYLCGINGHVDQLDSTACVLGAFHPSGFEALEESRPFLPGDTLLAYTDGALESRNADGRMLGITGMTRVIATCHRPESAGRGGLASAVLTRVEAHRFGPPEDDTLVVEIVRQIPPERPFAERLRRDVDRAAEVVDSPGERQTITASTGRD